ncbi:F0F1 ATP synthase assembly protein I [Gluconobacter sp. R75690]|uniref:AtpZ/AtpI family protein n=1 Tax=Gluconobacter TaxID=441 RepID=UPI00188CE9C8|nr:MULTISPECIES: AtpZ/AtpI family protein [unclassified Gluconobacter]MBF0849826.1 F0F1 ATP synthase assembly protein I [Gluconobacter sp. R75690]MBF0878727.1 F0F1 ATP synthase assembly protein I [Gluconobacter sp. R75828]
MGHAPAGDDGNFDERLRRARQKLDPRSGEFAVTDEGNDDSSMSSLGLAIRVGTDLVAGLAVGVAIGYALGHWFGYRALFLSVFALAGCGAGMLNVWRVLKDSDMVSGPKDDGRSQRGSRIDD